MYSGEIHYFRIPRSQWEDRIIKAKETGLNTVSSYIPWGWHEPREGKTDLTGTTKPERDVAGFIRLLQKHGLYFFCRPGPVTHGELAHSGQPSWLIENYPEIYVKKKDGSEIHPDFVSHMHPTYLKKVDRWYS